MIFEESSVSVSTSIIRAAAFFAILCGWSRKGLDEEFNHALLALGDALGLKRCDLAKRLHTTDRTLRLWASHDRSFANEFHLGAEILFRIGGANPRDRELPAAISLEREVDEVRKYRAFFDESVDGDLLNSRLVKLMADCSIALKNAASLIDEAMPRQSSVSRRRAKHSNI